MSITIFFNLYGIEYTYESEVDHIDKLDKKEICKICKIDNIHINIEGDEVIIPNNIYIIKYSTILTVRTTDHIIIHKRIISLNINDISFQYICSLDDELRKYKDMDPINNYITYGEDDNVNIYNIMTREYIYIYNHNIDIIYAYYVNKNLKYSELDMKNICNILGININLYTLKLCSSNGYKNINPNELIHVYSKNIIVKK